MAAKVSVDMHVWSHYERTQEPRGPAPCAKLVSNEEFLLAVQAAHGFLERLGKRAHLVEVVKISFHEAYDERFRGAWGSGQPFKQVDMLFTAIAADQDLLREKKLEARLYVCPRMTADAKQPRLYYMAGTSRKLENLKNLAALLEETFLDAVSQRMKRAAQSVEATRKTFGLNALPTAN